MPTIDADGMIVEDYCDFCEHEGHTFSSCPQRDDNYDFEEDW